MGNYHIIKSAFGGSEVFDDSGRQVGYSLPSVLGDGEDFFDMNGTPVGQSFHEPYGTSEFIGFGNDSYGMMDQEILMGQNMYLNGDPFSTDGGMDE